MKYIELIVSCKMLILKYVAIALLLFAQWCMQ